MSAVVGVLVAALAVGAVALAFGAPLLRKLGLRNAARRRLRAALIVFGLMLSTTVIGSAAIAGDSIAYTLRSLVAGTLGTVDEVIVLEPPHLHLREQVEALTEPGLGGLAAARLPFFDESEYDRVAQAVGASTAIAGVAPAIADQVTVVHTASRQVQSQLPLLALPPAFSPAFGALTAVDGAAVSLTALAADEVVVNQAAAESLGARAGDALQMRRDEAVWDLRVHAVTRNGGPGGAGPVLLVPLARYQQAIGRAGRINHVLVANHGGPDSVARSADAARELRGLFVDPEVARRLHDLLARPDVQRGLLDVAAELNGRERTAILALHAEAARPALTAEFVSRIADPRTRRRLIAIAASLPAGAQERGPAALLRDLSPLSVLEIKREALDQAEDYGAVVTQVFLVLGSFSLAAAALLIFLIFGLLAADRGPELATMRALGMRRKQVMAIFLFEGLVYNLLGALLGAAASMAAGYLLLASLAGALAPYGVELRRYVEPRSLLLALAGGALITFAPMLLAAWRVSRAGIVAGARGEQGDERPRLAATVLGLLLLLAAGVVWRLWRTPPAAYLPRHPLVAPGALSLALLGLDRLAHALVRPATRRGETASRLLNTLAGCLLFVLWWRVLAAVPTLRVGTQTGVVTIVVGALLLMLATVSVAMQGLHPLLAALDHALGALPRLRAVARPAAAYLRRQRGRTGVTVAMFAMVITIMVAALTLIDAVASAYGGNEPPVAGFDLRADLRPGSTLGPLPAALADAPAISPDAFRALGGFASLDVQSVQLGQAQASWRPAPLAIVDRGFLEGVQVDIIADDPRYSVTGAAWTALAEQPGLAVVAGQSRGAGPAGAGANPSTIWVRPNLGGRPVKLTVVGTVDPRSDLPAGIYVSPATAEGLGVALPPPATYYLAVRQAERLRDAAQGLRLSFGEQGLAVGILGEAEQLGRSVQQLLIGIVRGFMGLGLIAGVAALGLLGAQSVLERRQQLGTLRALGFTGRQVRATLAAEGAFTAALGVILGCGLGLILARSVVALLATVAPEIQFGVPWRQIAGALSGAVLGSILAIALTAAQAGRVAPAEALRVS